MSTTASADLVDGLSSRKLAHPAALAFGGYLVLSALFFAPRIAAHPERLVVGGLFTDPQIFIWSFAWWPHAILHGENPFVTHAVWAPSGFDLAWATSVPALALLFAPVTLLGGPVLAYDLACIVMPALAAWAAFLLCRRLTRSLWPSLVGGYLFGFSSYVLGGQLTHIHTVAIFLVPLVALLVLTRLDGELGGRRFALWLGVALALQAYLSTEVLFTLTLALACALVLAFLVAPGRRRALVALLAPLAAAYALAALLAAPLLYYAASARGSQPPAGSENFVADLLNFVVPTRASFGGWWSAGLAAHFPGNDAERGAYLGLPTLVVAGWYTLARWRTPAARFLALALLAAALAALGSWLTVDGRRVVALPWLHLAERPLFDDVMPVRFSAYAALAAAVIVALWAASTARPLWLRASLAALAVLAVLPNLGWAAWARSPQVPRLFTSALYRSCLPRGGSVLALPFGPLGDSMVWQVESGFWFRIAGGYVSPGAPPAFERPPSVQEIAANDLPPKVSSATVATYARLEGVGTVVLDAAQEPFWRPVLARLAAAQAVGGALLYRLSPASRALAAKCAAAARR